MSFKSILPCIFIVFIILGCGGGGNKPKQPAPIVYGKDQLFEPPILSGDFQVGTRQYNWVDESRGEPHTQTEEDRRELLVRIYYPAGNTEGLAQLPVFNSWRWPFWLTANNLVPNHYLRRSNYESVMWPVFIDAPINDSQGYFPLIVFSHGYGFSPEEHLVLAADLASRGFIVASINHPFGSSKATLADGKTVYAQELPRDNLGADLGLWSDDQVFAINQIELLNNSIDNFLYTKIDLSKIATSGHSYGGAAAYHSAAKDNRIKAAIDIDGTIFNSEGKYLSVPFMLIQSGLGDSYEIFDQVSNDGYGVAFNNYIHHHSFADYVLFWHWDFPESQPFGRLDGEYVLKASADIIEQFLQKYFDGETAPLLDDTEQILNETKVTFFD
jgi:pimeloyl-ACP methyl ester carboxylesterase